MDNLLEHLDPVLGLSVSEGWFEECYLTPHSNLKDSKRIFSKGEMAEGGGVQDHLLLLPK